MKRILLVCFLAFLCCKWQSQAQWIQTNGPYGGFVGAFAASGSNVFAGTFGGGVFLSTDNGTSWRAVSTGLTNTSIHALTVIGTNVFAGTGGGVFVSTNSGTSWTSASSGMTTANVKSLSVSDTILFAG